MNFVIDMLIKVKDITCSIMNMITLTVGNICYQGCDLILISSIFVLFPFESVTNKIELRNKILSNSTLWLTNKYNDICYTIAWNTCGVIAQWEHVNRKVIIPSFHKMTNNYFKPCVFLLKDGVEVITYNSWEQYKKAKETSLTYTDDYNIIIYTHFDLHDNNKKNYTVIGDSNLNNPMTLISHKSNVGFILFQLTTEGVTYDISLKEPKNFFIKDNTLNFPFFKWYMKKIHDVDLSETFSVNYMTCDMSTANLHNPFYIKFNEDGVTSFSWGKPKEPVVTKNNVVEESENSEESDNSEKSEDSDNSEESEESEESDNSEKSEDSDKSADSEDSEDSEKSEDSDNSADSEESEESEDSEKSEKSEESDKDEDSEHNECRNKLEADIANDKKLKEHYD